MIYRCNRKYAKGHTCSTPHFTDDEIKARFISALNKLLHCKDEAIANLEAMNEMLFSNTELETQSQRLLNEMETVDAMIHRAIAETARIALDQEACNRRFAEPSEKYEALNKRPALVAEFDRYSGAACSTM